MATHGLSDVCSRTFLYLTTFRRNLTVDQPMAVDEVRGHLKRILREQKSLAQQKEYQAIYPLYERAEKLLIYTADGLIRNSNWTEAAHWDQNSLESELLGTAGRGGVDFFQSINLPAYDEPQLAEVAFICLGLGFNGAYAGNQKKLDDEKARLFGKIDDVPREQRARITPEAYKDRWDRPMPTLPAVKTLRLVACLAGVLAFGACVYWFILPKAVEELFDIGVEISRGHEERMTPSGK